MNFTCHSLVQSTDVMKNEWIYSLYVLSHGNYTARHVNVLLQRVFRIDLLNVDTYNYIYSRFLYYKLETFQRISCELILIFTIYPVTFLIEFIHLKKSFNLHLRWHSKHIYFYPFLADNSLHSIFVIKIYIHRSVIPTSSQ